MPALRTPAQIEAARRNGARSRGPVTAEGKARSSRNALKHGLASPGHIILEGEDAAGFEALRASLIEEYEPDGAVASQLVDRLAITFWKQSRADRLEQKLFTNTDPPRFITAAGSEPGDPEAFFDVKRFNAIRGYQAQLSREVVRLLKELRLLRHVGAAQIEPEQKPSAANRNEPSERLSPAAARPVQVRQQPTPRQDSRADAPCLDGADTPAAMSRGDSLEHSPDGLANRTRHAASISLA
jgi:hypothetical protein